MTSLCKVELVNKYSKSVKTIKNRVVEVEFYWFQADPCQTYRLRMNEKQFNEAQKHIRSKKLLNMKFQRFIDLIDPLFANEAAEISNSVLRLAFDCLFDQNSNGKVEQQEIESFFILLQGFDTYKHNLFHGNSSQIFNNRNSPISFKEFDDFVKCGYLRELFMS